MNKRLVFLILALGMFGIYTKAQTEMLQTEENGFQWYKFFETWDTMGAKSKNGNILIPLSRGYKDITFLCNKNDLGYYRVSRNGKKGICDITGKEIISPDKYDDIYFVEEEGHGGWYCVSINSAEGALDITGREIIPCKYKWVSYSSHKRGCFYYKNSAGKEIDLDIKLDKQGRAYGSDIISSTPTSSSYNSSSSNNNSGGGTTTIVVEHQHTPQPVQEWQACFGCGGMGTMGCDNCGGSGTKYIGDRLHRCSRCNGQGIIPCNICYGSKGKYITVYR